MHRDDMQRQIDELKGTVMQLMDTVASSHRGRQERYEMQKQIDELREMILVLQRALGPHPSPVSPPPPPPSPPKLSYRDGARKQLEQAFEKKLSGVPTNLVSSVLSSFSRDPDGFSVMINTQQKLPQMPGRETSWNLSSKDEEIIEVNPENVARTANAFANSQRVNLIRSLWLGPKGTQQLMEETGLSGGQFYHHLKELATVGFLNREERGLYSLTTYGKHLSAIYLSIGHLAPWFGEHGEGQRLSPEEIGAVEAES